MFPPHKYSHLVMVMLVMDVEMSYSTYLSRELQFCWGLDGKFG